MNALIKAAAIGAAAVVASELAQKYAPSEIPGSVAKFAGAAAGAWLAAKFV